MTTTLQLGAVLPHAEIGNDPGAIKAYLQGLEDLGMRHLLVYDHVLGVDKNRPGGFKGAYDKDTAFHEPLTFLAFAAAVTTSIELVTTVLILPQRQAALVAKQVAEVAVLSGNRVRLGVGTGWNEVEYEALGVPFAARGARQEEQIELMRRLWSEDAFSFDGRFHKVSHAGINPRPSTPVPLWFGGSAPVALDRCARLGDGWMPLGGANDKTKEHLDTIRGLRADAGHTMDGFGVQAQAQFAGGSPEKWHAFAGKWEAIGATHLAIATHNAGETDVDGHLSRVVAFRDAVNG